MPAVNVLSKVDLLSERNKELLETFLEADTRSILGSEETTPWNEKYRKLTETVASVLDDYSLVRSSYARGITCIDCSDFRFKKRLHGAVVFIYS